MLLQLRTQDAQLTRSECNETTSILACQVYSDHTHVYMDVVYGHEQHSSILPLYQSNDMIDRKIWKTPFNGDSHQWFALIIIIIIISAVKQYNNINNRMMTSNISQRELREQLCSMILTCNRLFLCNKKYMYREYTVKSYTAHVCSVWRVRWVTV